MISAGLDGIMGKWFIECFLVFVGYAAAYTLTLGFIYPMQKIILPENSLLASLLFLPHGVRATAFFLFGLRAAIYLLPAHYAMWYISVHGANMDLDIYSPLVSLLACVIGYLLFLSIKTFLPKNIQYKGWILVLVIIILSAFFNSIGLSRLHSSVSSLEHFLAYFWGDVLGGAIFLILAMYIWRILKNTNFE
jgi:hypothetical protein